MTSAVSASINKAEESKMRNRRHQHLFNLCRQCLPIFLFGLLTGCQDGPGGSHSPTADAVVFSGYGTWSPSVIAVTMMLRARGLVTDTIGSVGSLAENLGNYQILVIPGGDPDNLLPELGPVGRSAILSFVNGGGGCLGLGGGAAVLSRTVNSRDGIPLLQGEARWPVAEIGLPPNYLLTDVSLAAPDHPLGFGGRNLYTTLYRWGPRFIPADSALVDVIYRYETTGAAAAVAFRYGFGTVFLAGFQPEIEENSDRDSTDFAQELADPETEWDMLERALDYCWPR